MQRVQHYFHAFLWGQSHVLLVVLLATCSLTVKGAGLKKITNRMERAGSFYPDADIKGKILDNNGNPVAGASVVNNQTGAGTTSDENGEFRIEAKAGEILVITKIGFAELRLTVRNDVPLSLKMQSSSRELEDVVVVGYGTQKSVNLTGAVDHVSAKILEDRPITRLSQGLQGAVAGLNIFTNTSGGTPNGTQTINIRGYSGLGVTGAPLVVIDGVQGGDINSINPADVESISVIKDAASAAIYGSSAPYGVLLITTKKGKKGAPPTVTYNNIFSWANTINLPKMMNSLDFAAIYNEAYANAGRGVAFTDEVIQRMKDYQAGRITDETVKTIAGTDLWGSWFESNANHDWFDLYFKDNVFSQQHNVGVSGGGAASDYYLGIGYNDREGMYNFGEDNFKRYSIRANINTAVNKWMSFGLRSMVTRSIYNTPNTYPNKTGGNYMHQIARKFPNVALRNPDGFYSDPSDVVLHLEGGRLIQKQDDAVITGEIQLKPARAWNITMNYTFDGSFFDQSSHTKTIFSVLPSGNRSPISGSTPNGFSRFNSRNEHHIINAFSSYEKNFRDHDFKILGGYVRELTAFTSTSASNTSLYSDNIPALSTTFNPTSSIGDQVRELAIEGFFGRFNYTFRDKYMLELNGRYDGTSRFLKEVRWKFYPGISAGWNIDQEKFWDPISNYVNRLKVRGSYGQLGDQGFLGVPSVSSWYPFYPSLGTVSPAATNWLFGSTQQASVSLPPLVNPDLTWVTTTSYGIGIDAAFLNNRLTARYDWFVRNARDFAGPSQVLPAVLGTTVPSANNTTIQTRGFELTVQWRDQIGKLNYSLRGVLSDYTGRVVEYPNPTRMISNWYSGENMGDIWGYASTGLYNSNEASAKALPAQFWTGRWQPGDVQYVDLDKSGRIDFGKNTVDSSGDLRIIGNSTPRYQYSFTLDLNWKQFDFSFFLQGVAKRDAWIGSNYFWGMQSSEWQSSPFTVHADTWTTARPYGYFPRPYMNDEIAKNQQVQTRYLQNAAYMRIKNVQLGYTIPENISSLAFMKRARIYIGVENLATFTKLIKTVDPELSISDAKIYPLQRTISCGANITF